MCASDKVEPVGDAVGFCGPAVGQAEAPAGCFDRRPELHQRADEDGGADLELAFCEHELCDRSADGAAEEAEPSGVEAEPPLQLCERGPELFRGAEGYGCLELQDDVFVGELP